MVRCATLCPGQDIGERIANDKAEHRRNDGKLKGQQKNVHPLPDLGDVVEGKIAALGRKSEKYDHDKRNDDKRRRPKDIWQSG